MIRRPPRSTLFPYTTLSRSNRGNLSGAGTIGDANLTLDNYGDIAALYSTELVLNTAANAITNEAGATLEAKSGGILEIDSNVTNLNATTSKIVADDGGTVELVSDTITGGTLQLASSGNATTLQIEGTVTLSATTTTTLSNSANNFIVSTSDETGGAASTLINRGNLSGAGTIGDANLTLDNYGDIAALYSTELVLNTAANAITNEAGATLEAKSGGILEIDSNVTNLNATTSKIVADDGGTVELVSDTITGGTLQLASSGNATTLQIEGTVTLSATTTTTLSNSANNFIVSTSDETGGAASTLINRGNLSGAGTIGDANLTLDNYGDIAALYSTELVLNTAANAITNEAGATLEAKSGGILEIDSNVTNLNATTSKIVADDGGTVELQGAAGDGVADQLDGAAVVGHDLAGGGVEVGDVAVDLEDAAALGLQRGAGLVGDGVGGGVEHQFGAVERGDVAVVVERQVGVADGAGAAQIAAIDQGRGGAAGLVAGADDEIVGAVAQRGGGGRRQRDRALDLQRGRVAARGELQGAAGDGVADQLDGAAVVGHDLAGGGVEVGDVAVDLEDAAALGLQRGAGLVGDGVGGGVEHQFGAVERGDVAVVVERQVGVADGAGAAQIAAIDQGRGGAAGLVAGADDEIVGAVAQRGGGGRRQRDRALDLQRGRVAARGELQGAAGDGVADQLDGAAVVGHDLAGGGVEVGDVAVDLEDAAALGLQRGAGLVGDGVGGGVEHQFGAVERGDVAVVVERQVGVADGAGAAQIAAIDQGRGGAAGLVAGADDEIVGAVAQR